MSQSNSSSTLRNLRSRHSELESIVRKKTISVGTLSSSDSISSIIFLRKAIKGLEDQIATKRTTKKAPKPSHSTRKGKFTKKQAEQYVKSFQQNYDEQSIKNINKLKKSKSKSAKKEVKKFDEKRNLYEFLINEFDL